MFGDPVSKLSPKNQSPFDLEEVPKKFACSEGILPYYLTRRSDNSVYCPFCLKTPMEYSLETEGTVEL